MTFKTPDFFKKISRTTRDVALTGVVLVSSGIANAKEVPQNLSVDKNISQTAIIIKRKKFLVKRAFMFILQGDAWYVFRGILRRIGILKYPNF